MTLYIVSTPIGNSQDITLRAINILKEVDFIICEEWKPGRRLLQSLQITKPLYSVNEQNEEENTPELLQLLQRGQKAALISDCGTPVFADPGMYLIQHCLACNISIVPVPGASSLMAALAVAGISLQQFHYAGFLSRKTKARRKAIRYLGQFPCPVVIYDTPYRLKTLLIDMAKEISEKRKIILAFCLTQKNEEVIRDTLGRLVNQYTNLKDKKEFVLILEPETQHCSKKKKT